MNQSTTESSFPVLNPSADHSVTGKLDDFTTSALLAEDDIIAPESLLDGDAIEDLLASLDNNQQQQQLDLVAQLPTNTEQQREEARDKEKGLLSGAYEFIQQSSSTGPGAEANTSSHADLRRNEDIAEFLRSDNEDNEPSSDEEQDEAAATKYVEDLLKEIETNPPSEESPIEPQRKEKEFSAGAISLPSNNNSNKNNEEEEDDDDNLSTRLAALSLPSVPSDQPASRIEARADSSYPECCCICYDTATVKCTDCEGNQLFCVRCWWEMHMADGSDGAESRHKAIKYEPS